jgi:hypothetical protein
MIEKVPEDNEKFIGLGSKEEAKGFGQGLGYEWYEKKYNIS